MAKAVLWMAIAVLSMLLIVSSFEVDAQTASSPSWSSSVYYQGDNGSVSVTISNSHSFQICTKQFYLQFDWMQSPNTVWASPDTPCIATGQSHTFTIQFSIPSSVTVGDHSYKFVWVDSGILLGSVTVNSGLIYIHDAWEKVFRNTQPGVAQALRQAQSANYKSPTAQADLNQAVNYYNQANTLANQGQWQSSVNDLNSAQSSLNQAATAEQSYSPPNNGGGNSGSGFSLDPTTMLVVIGATIALIVIGVVAIIAGRSRRSKAAVAVPARKVDITVDHNSCSK